MNTIENSNWDKVFKLKLKNAFDETEKLCDSNLDKNELVSKLSQIALDFFETFDKSPIPVNPPTKDLYIDELFVSASINLPSGCFMVPYFFYTTLQEGYEIDFSNEFSTDLPWLLLIGAINQKWLNLRKKLTKTDVLICKSLSRYNVTGQKYVFPLSNEILANRTRQSISSVVNSYASLFSRLIAQDFFLINPWMVGWNLYLIIYDSVYDNLFSSFDQLTLSKEFFYDNTIFRVIQQPFIHEDESESLKTLVYRSKGSFYPIVKTSFNWDISDLQPREDKSFHEAPDFTSNPLKEIIPSVEFANEKNSLDWLQNITSKESMKQYLRSRKSIKIEDLDDRDVIIRKERILKILNFLTTYGITMKSFEATAKSLNIPIHEFSRLLHYLIKTEVIALGHRFKFIGAGMEYSFIFRNGSEKLLAEIKQSLLNCCFSYFYEATGLIAGRCQVPDLWVNNFMEFIMRLRLNHPELLINLGQRVYGYSYFNPNVKMPKNYTLNEFGMIELIMLK